VSTDAGTGERRGWWPVATAGRCRTADTADSRLQPYDAHTDTPDVPVPPWS